MHILPFTPRPSRPRLTPALWLLATAQALEESAANDRAWLRSPKGQAASAVVRRMVEERAERFAAGAQVIRGELLPGGN